MHTIGDFMTKKEDLIIVKPSTSVDEALEKLVEYRITGFPVIDDDWTLSNNGMHTIGDFMTKKEDLIIVKPSTSVDEALEKLVEYRITGFPVIDDDWTLVGVVSDYDLLALNSISGCGLTNKSMFPEVHSTWKTFKQIQKLSSKTNGKTVGEMMTPSPLVVREASNLEAAARLLLETKYRRLPVVDSAGKLVGIITRGNVVGAALQLKHLNAKRA